MFGKLIVRHLVLPAMRLCPHLDFSVGTMSDICGFGGFPATEPNQSFRFVLPIFLHAGVLHLLLNLLAQCISSAQASTTTVQVQSYH